MMIIESVGAIDVVADVGGVTIHQEDIDGMGDRTIFVPLVLIDALIEALADAANYREDE